MGVALTAGVVFLVDWSGLDEGLLVVVEVGGVVGVGVGVGVVVVVAGDSVGISFPSRIAASTSSYL